MTQPTNNRLLTLALEERRNYRDTIPSMGSPDPVGNITNFVITAGAGYKMPARLYRPINTINQANLPVVLFLHGGGFVSGDFDTHDVLVRAIANGINAIVLAVEYRLAPESQAPVGIEDSYAALQWLYNNPTTHGGDIQRIGISGDSAGGNIATVVSALARDRNGPPILAQWLMYPVVNFDLTTNSFKQYGATNFPTITTMNFIAECYIPANLGAEHPLISPINGELSRLPPALISIGNRDPLLDGCTAYGAALKKANVTTIVRTYDGAVHAFIQYYKDPNNHPLGQEALNYGIQFMRGYLHQAT